MNKLIGALRNGGSLSCCGCSACVNVCPKQCLSMQADREGFLYPLVVAPDKCIDCGLCDKVCNVLHPFEQREPLECLGVKNNDDKVREHSSSGGIFTALAENVINAGGVVFGARFDNNWQVVIDHTETIEGIVAFRGSKYVQARVEDTYQRAKSFLEAGRQVLYSGTHCQIAGLNHFLRKEYSNLLTVDVVCHSVPSPFVWNRFLCDHVKIENISNINFRDKSTGWSNYGYNLSISTYDGKELHFAPSDDYMKCLTTDLGSRPACSDCMAKEGRSLSDITIGDYWGVWDLHPAFDDNKGVSIVLINSLKGRSSFENLNIQIVIVNVADLYKYNKGLYGSSPMHPHRDVFWELLYKGKTYKKALEASLNEKNNKAFLDKCIDFFKLKVRHMV